MNEHLDPCFASVKCWNSFLLASFWYYVVANEGKNEYSNMHITLSTITQIELH